MRKDESCLCDPARTIFVTGEPEMIRSYEPGFLDQFAAVLTSQSRINHRHVILRQQALPWHIGVRRKRGQGGDSLEEDHSQFGYDDFKRNTVIPKTKELSVVCSAKSGLEGHRQRVEFVQALKEHFGDRLDWFGRGFTPIEDKWDAIAPYRFHVCLENTSVPHYWTEKLADTYLGGAFPFYFGCANLEDYFPREAFGRIDVARPDAAISLIEEKLQRGIDDQEAAALSEAKRRVLDEYNLFPMLVELIRELPTERQKRIRIRREKRFRPRPSLWDRIKKHF